MMQQDNVVPMPDTLERLALGIKTDLSNATTSREAWIASMVAAAIKIAKARELHKDDLSFGRWWDAQAFDLNHQDRAALVAMGAQPDAMREVYGSTQRRSAQHIFAEYKGRFTHVSKPRRRKAAPKIERVQGTDLRGNRDAIAKQHGVSHGTVDVARAEQRGRDQLLDELKIDHETLSMSAQAKLAAAIRQAQRNVQAEHDARMKALDEEVRQRVLKEGKEYRDQMKEMQEKYYKEEKLYRELIDNHRSPFTVDQFKTILMCLHPDGERTKEKLEEAFRLFNAKKFQLTGKK